MKTATKTTTHEPSKSGKKAPAAGPPQPDSAYAQSAELRATGGGVCWPVGEGDSLWSIAEANYGDGAYWTLIRDANPGKVAQGGDLILVGTVLDVPFLDATHEKSTPTEGGRSIAKSCLHPPLRYDLGEIPVETTTVITPTEIIGMRLALKGGLTLQKKGECSPFSLDPKDLRLEADQTLGGITNGIEIDGVASGNVSVGFTTGNSFASHEVHLGPTPNSMRYVHNAAPIELDLGDWLLSGTFGYELMVVRIPRPQHPLPSPQRAPQPEPVEESWWARNRDLLIGVTLIVGAVALVAVTVAEDFATGGLGVSNDAVSFGTAAQMMRQGAQMAF